jgi:hypothetical protein
MCSFAGNSNPPDGRLRTIVINGRLKKFLFFVLNQCFREHPFVKGASITTLFQSLALPIAAGRTTIPGIKIHDTRKMRLLEVLLRGGPQLGGWRTAHIHAAILTAFDLTAERYSLTQLRSDVRKLKAHGLLERIGGTYAYRLTEKPSGSSGSSARLTTP